MFQSPSSRVPEFPRRFRPQIPLDSRTAGLIYRFLSRSPLENPAHRTEALAEAHLRTFSSWERSRLRETPYRRVRHSVTKARAACPLSRPTSAASKRDTRLLANRDRKSTRLNSSHS